MTNLRSIISLSHAGNNSEGEGLSKIGQLTLIALVAMVIGGTLVTVVPSFATTPAASASSSTATFSVTFHITPLTKISSTKYYNIQTVTVTNIATGKPVANAKVSLLEDCGCHGGYAHGYTNASGHFSHKDTYGGPGNYREYASVTFNGITVISQTIIVKVP